MPKEGYTILVTPENCDYLEQVCIQLGERGYFYPKCKALNIFRSSGGNWDVFTIHSFPSSIFDRCTLITEEQLRQLMFIYFLEN